MQKLAQAKEHCGDRNQKEMNLVKSQPADHTLISHIDGIVTKQYLALGERVENLAAA